MSYVVGYARTSTVEQHASFEGQQAQLVAAGADKLFAEQVSAVSTDREQLDAALSYLRDGDTLVVCRLDRLARSLADLMGIVSTVEERGASLRVLDMNLDTATATGKLMLGVIGSVAEFERSLMLERQRIGIAKAKAEGKYKGRKPTAMEKADKVMALLEDGLSASKVAAQLGISRSSVMRIKRAAKDAQREPEDA